MQSEQFYCFFEIWDIRKREVFLSAEFFDSYVVSIAIEISKFICYVLDGSVNQLKLKPFIL